MTKVVIGEIPPQLATEQQQETIEKTQVGVEASVGAMAAALGTGIVAVPIAPVLTELNAL